WRAKLALETSQAANQSLEAGIAERTAHLVAANEQIRHSTSVLQSTFNSMAEAVLVIDTRGAIVLSNPAAERMLRFRSGMNVENLRALSAVYQSDGTTPIAPEDMPAARVLRGEPFLEQEIVVHPYSGKPAVHLVVSGRPLHNKAGAISGAALVYHDITRARET